MFANITDARWVGKPSNEKNQTHEFDAKKGANFARYSGLRQEKTVCNEALSKKKTRNAGLLA
ncbi:hypothetical protein HQN60_13510 [Deefgea piscis]|uniref:Uncharacterized protein n=1 Tax=Deefgea piscis TaxID=2739061 RepID=A0A6M8T0W4_9NEIS|nr:hypothetical protein [Deefgea piscis]QKJ67647.1 hypothetical protein HQN60_13510 [Deefgea piscis]